MVPVKESNIKVYFTESILSIKYRVVLFHIPIKYNFKKCYIKYICT